MLLNAICWPSGDYVGPEGGTFCGNCTTSWYIVSKYYAFVTAVALTAGEVVPPPHAPIRTATSIAINACHNHFLILVSSIVVTAA